MLLGGVILFFHVVDFGILEIWGICGNWGILEFGRFGIEEILAFGKLGRDIRSLQSCCFSSSFSSAVLGVVPGRIPGY